MDGKFLPFNQVMAEWAAGASERELIDLLDVLAGELVIRGRWVGVFEQVRDEATGQVTVSHLGGCPVWEVIPALATDAKAPEGGMPCASV